MGEVEGEVVALITLGLSVTIYLPSLWSSFVFLRPFYAVFVALAILPIVNNKMFKLQ